MNAFDIIAVIAIALLAFLTWTNIQKRKKSENTLKEKEGTFHIKDAQFKTQEGEIIHLKKEIETQRNIIRERDKSIDAGMKAYDELSKEKEGLYRKYEELISVDPSKLRLGPKGQDVESFLRENEGFVQSADISIVEIRLNVKDLIEDEYINVIKGLDKIGLFPMNLQEDYNFNPKNMAVHFETIVDGDPKYFKSWKDIVSERNRFIKVINSYVESVINQRKINLAVDEALNGKEATSA